jgi:hypothetical protein
VADRRIRWSRSGETPGRPGGGEPERGPRRSHGRGRARSGREPLPATGPACPKHGSAAARPHSSAETMGFRALAGIGLVGTFQGDWPPRGHRADSEQGSAAGGGATECTGERAAMCNVNDRQQSTTTPCRSPHPVLRFRASRGYGRHSRTSPVSLGHDPAER